MKPPKLIYIPDIKTSKYNDYEFKVYQRFYYKETRDYYDAGLKRMVESHRYQGGQPYNEWSHYIPINKDIQEYCDELDVEVDKRLKAGLPYGS